MLKNKDFKYRYSTGRKDLPFDFCLLALSNSTKLDIGLGYFSSASFNVLSIGFAHFIINGGKMRLYINQYLMEDDYNLLRDNQIIDFEEYILRSFNDLKTTLSKRDEHFFKCLSYLIQINRIEIKIVIPKDGGLAHEKFGVFTDEKGDKVAFTGSMNLTAAALVKNIETIECTCSWKSKDNQERITISEQDFAEIWSGANNNVFVFPAKKFCQEVIKTYPNIDTDELLLQEKEIIRKLSSNIITKEEIIPTIQTIKEPHFPYKYPDGARPYQIEAYKKWIQNGKQGIFAMATGTGKTITSLNCVLQEYLTDGVYQLLILVPTIALVEQWIDEVGEFDFKNIIPIFSENKNWRKQVVSLKNSIKKRGSKNFVLLSTYQSFLDSGFQQILPQLPNSMILIADEAHNIGSESVRAVFRKLHVKRKIALSATPNRIYDEEGTAELESFFNDKPPYVYNFSMKRAIDEGRLMNYCYYPKIVYLNDDEMQDYAQITEQLMRLFDNTTKEFKDGQKAKKLLMLRKRILHKANDKMRVFMEIITEIGEDKLKYCFVYVPEGKKIFDSDEALYYSNTDNDSDDTEIYEEAIVQKMLDMTKNIFPNTTCNTYTGKNSKTERKTILQGFENGQINVLFAMKCLDEGVDVPRAEYGIFASSTGNPRQFIQRRGRLLRRHDKKKFAYIYDMIVVPDYQSPLYSKEFWDMERSLVRSELARVAYFADTATNYHIDIEPKLREIAEFYDLVLSELVLSINQ
ncbi:superfamily II DNA or RNA helicase [Parabacteroides sp. PFB2-10]|uniref:DEAD/DEAH box helicase family protein n=1 Tax=Parabacteroides sp. PFB2-10 TaxID=1742405 RepID=UPI00247703DE|nr:DEAD/DEAH box helicase family protein [Parabacteroides sp. PFB2-10]MDH6312997.1 superfamily II DNA or RNA helicase [Parabacteroides sp. PFB2-10]